MSITFDANPNGLFDRLGKMGKLLTALNDYRGSTTIGPRFDDIRGQFTTGVVDVVDSLYATRDSYRSGHSGLTSALKTLAANTCIRMADADAKLTQLTIKTALEEEIIPQMISGSVTVNKSVVAATVTPGGSNVGNGFVVASVKGPDGKDAEYVLPETFNLRCSVDKNNGAAAARETIVIFGENVQSDATMWDWPKGSGTATQQIAVDAAEDAGSNKLTNGDYEDVTANVPNNWTLAVGTAGTHCAATGSSDAFKGSQAIKIRKVTADATLPSLTQQFNLAGQTTATLKSKTAYAVNLWHKVDSGMAAGVLSIELIDGSGNVINDDSGTANAKTVTLSASPTTYTGAGGNVNAVFRTPTNLPATVKLRIRISTASTDDKYVFIDHVAFKEMSRMYNGGPYIAVFSGSVDFVVGDKWTIAVTNTFGGFQKFFEQMFGMRDLGLQLPSSGAPTIADSKLT